MCADRRERWKNARETASGQVKKTLPSIAAHHFPHSLVLTMNGEQGSHNSTCPYTIGQDIHVNLVPYDDPAEYQGQGWAGGYTSMVGQPFRVARALQGDQMIEDTYSPQGHTGTLESDIDYQADMIRYGQDNEGSAFVGDPMADHIDP